MRETLPLFSFNRGLVSPLGLARTDQKRVSLSAETMVNFISRVLGSMALRPGMQYIGATRGNAAARMVEFIFATNDTSIIEFTDSNMRIWINDVLLTRTAVSTTITNGTFAGNITGWTDGSDAGGSIGFDTGNLMMLTGDGINRAIGYQTLTVSAADQINEHGVKVVIARGPVTFKVGTSLGDDSLVSETSLDTGSFSFGFTPGLGNASVYVQFINTNAYKAQVSQCTIEAAGVVTIASPYLAADLSNIRATQSGDTVFLAGTSTYQQRKVERRGTRPGARSWGISLYRITDGPFLNQNFGSTTISASGLTGDITLTASRPLFKSGHVGALWKLINQVAGVSASLVAQNTFTASLKVTGSGIQRSITITLTGLTTWVAIVSLQVSTDNSTFTDVPGFTWNGNVTGPYLDGLDGQTRYYRIGVKTGNYTSGTIGAALTFTSGSLAGIALITGFTSNLVVSAQVVSDMGATTATAIWAEGAWSGTRRFPTASRIHEGRLWWAGQNGLFGTVSDSYFSFDDNVLGDAGPIDRTIGSGPVDTINWILSLQRMIVGAQGAEFSVKSSAFDTPLTPTDFTIKAASTQGSQATDALRIDQRGIYVDRSGTRVYEVLFDLQSYEYASNDLTQIVPELGLPGIVRVGLQRKPDTRIHCVRSDGTVMLGVLDKIEDVLAWQNVTSAGATGLIEDVVVLPAVSGTTEDQVYYVVNRTVNGAVVRYLEKWAREVQCRGGAQNLQADSFLTYSGPPVTTLTAAHLAGAKLIVWADSIDYSPGVGSTQTTFTADGSGNITLTTPVQNAVFGLPYTAQWQSAKLGLQPSLAQSLLTKPKRISHLGIVAAWFHAKGLQFGTDFTNLDDLPGVEDGSIVAANALRVEYDKQDFIFPGSWDTDSRLALQAAAPRPCTMLAAIIDLETSI